MGILAKNKIRILMIAIFAAFSIGGNAFADTDDSVAREQVLASLKTSALVNDPSRTSQELKVLVIENDPILTRVVNKELYKNNNGSPRVSEWFGYDLDKSINELKQDIQESSHNYLNVKIVKREFLNELPHYTQSVPFEDTSAPTGVHRISLENYVLLTRSGWVASKKYSAWQGDANSLAHSYVVHEYDKLGFIFDYEWLIKKYDLINRRNKGEFDQVWLFTVPLSQTHETIMVGKNPYWINGTSIPKNCDNFILAGFNVTRPDSMMHSLGHAMENIMTKIYGHRYDYGGDSTYKVATKAQFQQLNYWEKYTMTPHNNSANMSGVGIVHYPYNTKENYGYIDDNFSKAKTNWREWLNFPSVPGNSFVLDDFSSVLKSDINKSILGKTNQTQENDRLWLRFWFGMMPHISGATSSGYMLNWWKYFYSMDKAISLQSELAKTNRSELKKGESLCAGYTIKYLSGRSGFVCNVKNGAFTTKIANTKVIDFVDGVLKGKAAGTTDVTFAHDGQKLTIKVTVK